MVQGPKMDGIENGRSGRTTATQPPKRALLIEDNAGDARLVREALREAGADQGGGEAWDLVAANCLVAGLAHLEQTKNEAARAPAPFEVVLLDLSLPDSRGLTTLERVRAAHSDVAVVVLTGMDDHQTALAAVAGGAQDFLSKGQIEGSVLARAMRYARERQRLLAALGAANVRLAALATHDGLTGLKNHRAFQDHLEAEVERARRYNSALTLALLDVDHFKHYNDAFGHPAGDQVLRQVADLLQAGARATDVVARYGGEEFAVILPHTDQQNARTVAERFRSAIADFDWAGGGRVVTASFGVATLMPAHADRHALVDAADRALYAAKREGRNRVAVAQQSLLAAVATRGPA